MSCMILIHFIFWETFIEPNANLLVGNEDS